MDIESRNLFVHLIYPDSPVKPAVSFSGLGQHCIDSHSYSWDGLRRMQDGGIALIQYTVRGRGALEYGGRCYPVEPGQAMLLTFPEAHRYFLPEDSDYWEVLFANLRGAEAVRMVRELRQVCGPVATPGVDSLAMEMAYDVLLRRQRLLTPLAASAAAYRFLTTFCDETLRGLRGVDAPDFVERIMKYCRENPGGDLSVDHLAALAGCSRWHFTREFKSATGWSPLELVVDLRMKLAAQLLHSDMFSVKEIADRCGYRSVSYFVRAFRRYYTVSPGTFRRRQPVLNGAESVSGTPGSSCGGC